MIRIAVPGSSAPFGTSPAPTIAATRRRTGCAAEHSARSALRTAKPSMAELSNGGRDSREAASSRNTRPSDSARGARSAGSGAIVCRIVSCTVSSATSSWPNSRCMISLPSTLAAAPCSPPPSSDRRHYRSLHRSRAPQERRRDARLQGSIAVARRQPPPP